MISISRRWILSCVLVCVTISLILNLSQDDPWTPPPPPMPHLPAEEAPPLPPGFTWKDAPMRNPIKNMIPMPTGRPSAIPPIQYDFPKESTLHRYIRQKRLSAVKNAFRHSWEGYKKNAWLQDEVRPLSGGYKNGFGGWGATLVDSLDTLWIMGSRKDFDIAVDALKYLDFTISSSYTISVFETTIRYVGGLLSAYDLSGGEYPILLEKATDLGDMLYGAFDTPNNLPVTHWNWLNAAYNDSQEAPINALTADIGSLSLEFTRLTQLTGDPKYFDAVQRIMDAFDQQQNATKLPGMWPVSVDARNKDFTKDKTFTLGAMADSLYEYLPKQYLLLGGLDKQCQRMYEKALETAKEHLFFRPLNPQNQRLLISGSIKRKGSAFEKDHGGQHLTCFVGGMVGLASKAFDIPDDMAVATQLTDGCVWAYESMPSGIMPELFTAIPCEGDEGCKWSDEKWYEGIRAAHHDLRSMQISLAQHAQSVIKQRNLVPGFVDITDKRYYLRPEAIESVFYLYRITGDRKWQDKAWRMFQAIESHTRTDIAYAVVNDVTMKKSLLTDTMESFWTGETLKYFFLIFSEPDLVSLDDYVLNTEAHPLRRPQR